MTLVDTAPMYSSGESERRVGELVRERGGDVQIATRFSPSPWQLAGSLPAMLDESLARLGVDAVTLHQVHFPHPLYGIPTLMKHLAAAVVLPIPAKDAEQARVNAGALGFALTPEERAELSAAAPPAG